MIIDSRYNVLERLGTGFWATVYKVEDIRTNKIYALKLFHNIAPKKLYEKFSAEDMHKIARLRHPNLIHIYDFGIDGKHIYFLSEFIQGRSLRFYNFKPYHLDFFYDIVVQICYALNALHKQGIVHKDLKLDNIMFSIQNQKPKIKILDYGFSRLDSTNNQQKISGTFPFIAPEVLRGGEYTYQSDFYSLGVILYKLTTGTLPFSTEEITNYITGKGNSFFPKFPRELNDQIPEEIEKLILKLLDMYPRNRFSSAANIVRYINRIQLKKYSFSPLQSVIDSIRFSSYFVRSDYAHRLIDYIPNVEENNGKVVVMIGGKGIGKNNLLSLFRYHLLEEKYFIFDYQCSARQQDPFFALIKEFYSYLMENRKLSSDHNKMSLKFKKFMYESEDEANTIESTENELELDFISARDILFQLSEVRPLIFIIRAGQYLTEATINFVNHISNEIRNRRILIIIGVNDPSIVQGLIHPVQMKIEPLSRERTAKYIQKLLQTQDVPSDFITTIWKRTYGNPHFIKETLIDLTKKKLIWNKNHYNFDVDFAAYNLPDELLQTIFNMMAHLKTETYRYLQILSLSCVPMTKKLIEFLLNIHEKQLFLLLQDSINNEILIEDNSSYTFTYSEAKRRLIGEIPKENQILISQQILEFYDQETIDTIDICKGLIENSELADNFTALRKYKLKLIDFYSNNYEQDKAFQEIVDVIKLDFSGKIEISQPEIKKDLRILREKTELTGSIDNAIDLLKTLDNLPDFFEKHFIFGVFYSADGEFSKAKKCFEKALEMAYTGITKVETLIHLAWTFIRLKKVEKAEEILNQIDNYHLNDTLEVFYIDRKAVLLSEIGQYLEATNLVEEFLPHVKEHGSTQFMLRLGSLYNNLAYNYSQMKMLEQAKKHFKNAKKIWEKVSNRTALPLVYNNLGDIYLQEGKIAAAIELFRRSVEIAEKYNQGRGLTLAWVNFAEAYIKAGKFKLAKENLDKALQLEDLSESKLFMNSIISNKAIIYGKSGSLSRYFKFIQKNNPALVDGVITSVTPLTKTYFYYLYHIGQAKKIKSLLQKNMHIDFIAGQMQEFYYQIQALLAISDGDIQSAIENLKVSADHASKNAYASTIVNLILSECYIHINDIEHAEVYYNKSMSIAKENEFEYWISYLQVIQCQINLMKPTVPLRKVLRTVFRLLKTSQEKDYTTLIIKSYRLLIEIYDELKSHTQAKRYFIELKEFIKEITTEIPEEDRLSLIRNLRLYDDDLTNFKISTISPRRNLKIEHWGEQLYNLIKLKNTDRIKFFINRYVNDIISPFSYAIILNDQLESRDVPFLSHNLDMSEIYNPRRLASIEESFSKSRLIRKKEGTKHLVYLPLGNASSRIGVMFISDDGELTFSKSEIATLKVLRLHLSSILVRIQEYSETQKQIHLMERLMQGSQRLNAMLDLEKLEKEILTFAIELTNANRGFLIKQNVDGTYENKHAIDGNNRIISPISAISKSVIHEVIHTKQSIYTSNAIVDNIFKSSISVQDYSLHSIYCMPIYVNEKLYCVIYLDDYEAIEYQFEVKERFMEMFRIQARIAIQNATEYRNLMHRNSELKKIDGLKNDFLGIVSHELNTPMVFITNYVNRIKRNRFSNDEDRAKVIDKLDKGVDRMRTTTNDIITLYKYKMVNRLKTEPEEVQGILKVLKEEAEILATKRRLKIQLELENDLPEVLLNWEAFHLMVYNLVQNSIRYTKDGGRIIIGVRRSAFQTEEVNGKESIVVYVQDNGKGIPEEELENVFKSFYEIKDIYSHKSGLVEYDSSGLGIGLTTVKCIAELHDGKIWIKSSENQGTTVFVAMPIFDKSKEILGELYNQDVETND
jgi:serine/threonine protein kinase/signal transduction histidine kinase/Tfp pilus assembly protein PilF